MPSFGLLSDFSVQPLVWSVRGAVRIPLKRVPRVPVGDGARSGFVLNGSIAAAGGSGAAGLVRLSAPRPVASVGECKRVRGF